MQKLERFLMTESCTVHLCSVLLFPENTR